MKGAESDMKMSEKDFREIFNVGEEHMQSLMSDVAEGFYCDLYQLACDRMLESELDAMGLALNENELTSESVLEYIMMVREGGSRYTLAQWVKDTKENYPESFMQDQKSDEESKFMSVDDFIKMFDIDLMFLRKLQVEYWKDTQDAKDGTVDLEQPYIDWARDYMGNDLMANTSSDCIPYVRKELRDVIGYYINLLKED